MKHPAKLDCEAVSFYNTHKVSKASKMHK